MLLRVFTFISVLFTADAIAAVGKGHVSGKITNITSISSGLLVRINTNEVPEHCTSGRVWMQIKQENTAMTSLTLTAWTLKRDVTVYTSSDNDGYC